MIRFLQTPGPVKKIVLSGILLIFCAAMVITLIPGGLGTSLGLGAPGAGVIATIGGEQVTTQEVQKEARRMVQQQFPKGNAMSAQLIPFFAQRAADQLISEKTVVVEAQRMGLKATDQELRDDMQQGQLGQLLFPDGNFVGQEAYEDFVARNDMTVPQFENKEKEYILIDKLRQMITSGAVVTESEVRNEFSRRNTKVKFDYAILSKDDIAKTIHPTDMELATYYEKHKANYANSIPEKRKVKFAIIDTAKLEPEQNVTPQQVEALYHQNEDQYRVPDQVELRHIFIKTPLPGTDGKVDPKALEESRKKADEALKQVKGGADFATVAAKFNEDPATKDKGGSLGWMKHGSLPNADVEKAAFSLPKGGTSDVINTGYAFDIIHVDDTQPAHLKPLAEVKDQIETTLKQQKAQQAAQTLADKLVTDARSQGFDKAVAGKGLVTVATDYVSRTDSLPGIGSSPQFTEALFSAQDKAPPDSVQVPQGYIVYQLDGIQPPSTPTFKDIRSRVETEFKNEKTEELLNQKTQELSDRAKADHDLKKAAKESGAAMKTSDFVLPDGQVPDVGSMSGPASVAFTLKPGEISGPINAGNNGVVLVVLEKQEPTPDDFANKKDEIRNSLLQTKQNELFNLFVDNLRNDMEKSGKLKINEQELKTLTRNAVDQGE
jgi:peptidyl-prolyl cis-trans isomerase D